MSCLALTLVKKHIFQSAQGIERRLVGIPGFCMRTSAQLALLSAFPCSAEIPPASRLQSSPAHKFPEDESFTALGAQQYHLFILGFGTKSICFTPQLISRDKRSHQQNKSKLLCGSAEVYTRATSQADLYLIWFSFAILIFKNKNGSITLKKK